jgi:hypothetical protein
VEVIVRVLAMVVPVVVEVPLNVVVLVTKRNIAGCGEGDGDHTFLSL